MFRYYDRTFESEVELIETLLHEANGQILMIDIGDIKNTRCERNQVSWRLRTVGHHLKHPFFKEVKTTYNSLWSQLYRLEHQCEYEHPYLKQIQEKLVKINEEESRVLCRV